MTFSASSASADRNPLVKDLHFDRAAVSCVVHRPAQAVQFDDAIYPQAAPLQHVRGRHQPVREVEAMDATANPRLWPRTAARSEWSVRTTRKPVRAADPLRWFGPATLVRHSRTYLTMRRAPLLDPFTKTTRRCLRLHKMGEHAKVPAAVEQVVRTEVREDDGS